MRRIVVAIALAVVALSANADQKNVKLLTGLTDLELQRNMNLIRASLGVHCDYCHVTTGQEWDWASDAKAPKKTALSMIKMVMELNQRSFEGRPVINCNTCHNGHTRPASMPPLPQTAPPFPTPVEDRKGYPEAKDLIARHIAAIGGADAAEKVSTVKTITAKGTRVLNGNDVPFEMIVANPGKLLLRYDAKDGSETQIVTDEGAWARTKDGAKPIRPSQVENIRAIAGDFQLFVPAASEDAKTMAKESIDGHDAWVVAMRVGDHIRQRLFFDATSGLLVRRIVLKDGPVGRVPEQIDYSDYRDAGGAKVPFTVRVALVDPWAAGTRKYSEMHLNAAVDEGVFSAPK